MIISQLATALTVYLLCKHKKLRTLIASIDLHHIEELGTVTQKDINTECKTLTYIGLVVTILGLAMLQFCITENQNYAGEVHSQM